MATDSPDSPVHTPANTPTAPCQTSAVPTVVELLTELVDALPLCEHRTWWASTAARLEPADLSPARVLVVVFGDLLLDLSAGCRCWPTERIATVRAAVQSMARVLALVVFDQDGLLDYAVADARLVVVSALFDGARAGRAER